MRDKVEGFVFDDKVASVFSDMIQRSVPGYIALNQLLPIVAQQYVQNNSKIYDLGCSLGEASIALARAVKCDDIKIIAIDNSQAMIDQLQNRLFKHELQDRITVVYGDVNKVEISNASFVILNYTLQFIERSERDDLIAAIANGLRNGGALLLSEKISYEDADEDSRMQQLHEAYKRKNDYSELEISQKREALENVLIRDTHERHVQRLENAGFGKISILASYLNFVSYLAIKS